METDLLHSYMQAAIRKGKEGLLSHVGGPFGAIIVRNGTIIGAGSNQVTSTNDPTAHAEIVAIRQACKTLNTFSLEGAILFTSCQPCPMCLSAIYWARIKEYYFGATPEDAKDAGFDDSFFYEELKKHPEARSIPSHQILHKEALELFSIWKSTQDKIPY